MTTAHTPGPWTYSGTAGHESHGQLIVIPEKEGRTVCLVYGGHANAPLIAAAPELLAALEAILPMFDNDSPLLTVYDAEIKQARAAIDKAKGL